MDSRKCPACQKRALKNFDFLRMINFTPVTCRACGAELRLRRYRLAWRIIMFSSVAFVLPLLRLRDGYEAQSPLARMALSVVISMSFLALAIIACARFLPLEKQVGPPGLFE